MRFRFLPQALAFAGALFAIQASSASSLPSFDQALQLAESGDADGAVLVGSYYFKGYQVEADNEKAVYWFTKAAERGSPEAQVTLGAFYAEGSLVPQDYALAHKWCEKAAANGSAEAYNFLGLFYENGQGVPADSTKSCDLFEKAAKGGSSKGQYNLSLCYERGQGHFSEEPAKAVYWCTQAAKQGMSEAQFSLAQYYNFGYGTDIDLQKAADLYEEAGQQGHVRAQVFAGLSFMGVNDNPLPEDYVRAAKWLKLASRAGDADAQYFLGLLYLQGLGVEQDMDKGMSLIKKAAAQGHEEAISELQELE